MDLQKHIPPGDAPLINIKSLSFTSKENGKASLTVSQRRQMENHLDIDLKEVYFLIMHFLSAGPCLRTYGQLWNELLEHQLLPRRYHAWYSRTGSQSRDENDNGMSFPLGYNKLVERHPHIGQDHLVKLLKQLMMLDASAPAKGMIGGNVFNAANVPTLLGTGSFSLLANDQNKGIDNDNLPPAYMLWPHRQADQVCGLRLREIGGGFTRHHRAPSTRAACHAIIKPSTLVQKMQNIKRVRGHRNAVYCAIFDRSGRYVVTGSDDRLVKIWSMEAAYCLASCRGHEGDITDLAVNFNNTLVASASNDCVIRVWRLPDGMPISVLRGHTGAVTAIAFSPRSSAPYQLLSSSDDGSCRIWDARYSQFSPRIYVSKPSDSITGRNNVTSSSTTQQTHQIFCCTFNASGTFFVTGSSDTLARVWNAFKSSSDDSEQPNHEIDILAGHENDVNYVQFSGCAVNARFSFSDASKEDVPKFKNSWFNHDNIVTCSRDGSAIIWIPRSRKSHGKSGRWIRAYHLKVPPPPMPPQPPRGGPRQRILPTPRGVNMIAWSLDNRFVLATIMDCRICVWNAVDGSLVHSLTGHTESTYVLDVHPFNPRIAMSAGYDGKTIVWDIWEGTPIRTYEIGQFKLIDGKFSPDGTSIILSDDVGQLYILNTGQGESQKDAKYDQFFLGDYRPLIQDMHGNVLDQETQLAPYRRNMQDLLCDSGMIPYPEPYQSMYQKRRLGGFGIEWRPSSIRLSVGVDFSLDQDYVLPIIDLDTYVDPLPEFVDAMEWEPEIEILSDDNDSEYHVTEDNSSGGERVSLSSNSGDPDCSSESSEEDSNRDGLRRSKRKRRKAGADVTTSSGRLVKRKILDECDDNLIRNNHARKLKNGRKTSKKKSYLKSSRPQRAAARNALHLFSRITGTSTDGDVNDWDGNSSESESTLQDSGFTTEESEVSSQNEWDEHSKGKETSLDPSVDVDNPYPYPESHSNSAGKKRLIIKFPNRDASKFSPQQSNGLKIEEIQGALVGSLCKAPLRIDEISRSYSQDEECGVREADGDLRHPSVTDNCLDYLGSCKDGSIRWGGVKTRTSKRLKIGEILPAGLHAGSGSALNQHVTTERILNGHSTSMEYRTKYTCSLIQTQEGSVEEVVSLNEHICGTIVPESLERVENDEKHLELNESKDANELSTHIHRVYDGTTTPSVSYVNGYHCPLKENSTPVATKLRINSTTIPRDYDSPSKFVFKSSLDDNVKNMHGTICDNLKTGGNLDPKDTVCDDTEIPCSDNRDRYGMTVSEDLINETPGPVVEESLKSDLNKRMFTAVYRRSKQSKSSSNPEGHYAGMEASTSNSGRYKLDYGIEIAPEGIRRARSIRLRSAIRDPNVSDRNFKFKGTHDDSDDPSADIEKASVSRAEENSCEEWRSNSRTSVRLRATRIRKGGHYIHETSPADRRKSSQLSRSSWLTMSAHEEGSRYIPQLGDEVVYLRQGHQEYIGHSGSRETGPWETIKQNIKAVEFCRVQNLEYSTCPGSGVSSCKMTLKFVSPSDVVGSFKLTLPEVTGFPDFLVEKCRYDAAVERNWTSRDKCQVWWKNEGYENGSWWDGRILAVKPKSFEFPDSPWERYVVKYKSDPTETHLHSPWELYDADTNVEQLHIDVGIREELFHAFEKLEQSGFKSQDYYGVNKLKQVSQKTQFINRFPVPLTLELIQSRLENNYYRSLEAMKHDIEVMLSNADTYFGKNAELSLKMKRLSDWFRRTLLPL